MVTISGSLYPSNKCASVAFGFSRDTKDTDPWSFVVSKRQRPFFGNSGGFVPSLYDKPRYELFTGRKLDKKQRRLIQKTLTSPNLEICLTKRDIAIIARRSAPEASSRPEEP
ncbi:hypothetical protein HN011_008621 [Eciton burchellii]|nr:hypothetical protein HN011_008621 [Eciton burchellii]